MPPPPGERIAMSEQITSRQRNVQREKIDAAIKLLEAAALETYTATPSEIAQTVDVAIETITKVSEFLKTRPGNLADVNYNYVCGCDSPTATMCMRHGLGAK